MAPDYTCFKNLDREHATGVSWQAASRRWRCCHRKIAKDGSPHLLSLPQSTRWARASLASMYLYVRSAKVDLFSFRPLPIGDALLLGGSLSILKIEGERSENRSTFWFTGRVPCRRRRRRRRRCGMPFSPTRIARNRPIRKAGWQRHWCSSQRGSAG